MTGLQIGAIPPFGHLFEIPTYVEENLGLNTVIAFNAGDRRRSVTMNYADYMSVCGGIIGQYAA